MTSRPCTVRPLAEGYDPGTGADSATLAWACVGKFGDPAPMSLGIDQGCRTAFFGSCMAPWITTPSELKSADHD
jgi:hypothetical protein